MKLTHHRQPWATAEGQVAVVGVDLNSLGILPTHFQVS